MTGKTWTYGVCESCLKNSHERFEMKKEIIVSGDSESKYSQELWVCSKCGATKRF